MNIIESQLQKKLQHFESEDAEYIEALSTYSLNVNRYETYILLKAVRSISDVSTDQEKETFIDLLEDLYVKEQNPVMHLADKGENVKIDIKLREGDNYTGSMLIARDAVTKAALSSDELEGTSATIQQIIIDDIDYPVGTFVKVLILSEGIDDSSGTNIANGDVNSVLSKMYIYIDEESEA